MYSDVGRDFVTRTRCSDVHTAHLTVLVVITPSLPSSTANAKLRMV